MQSADQPDLDEIEREATRHADLQEYDAAEQLFREVLRRRLKDEGIPATYTDMYNLGQVLVKNHKYEEALPILRELFVYLSQRISGRDTSKFVEMETNTARLLAQCLEGQRQLLMAKESKDTEEGLYFSDSSEDDDENTPAAQLRGELTEDVSEKAK